MTNETMRIQFSVMGYVRDGCIDVVLALLRVISKLLVSLMIPIIALTICCIVKLRQVISLVFLSFALGGVL